MSAAACSSVLSAFDPESVSTGVRDGVKYSMVSGDPGERVGTRNHKSSASASKGEDIPSVSMVSIPVGARGELSKSCNSVADISLTASIASTSEDAISAERTAACKEQQWWCGESLQWVCTRMVSTADP